MVILLILCYKYLKKKSTHCATTYVAHADTEPS